MAGFNGDSLDYRFRRYGWLIARVVLLRRINSTDIRSVRDAVISGIVDSSSCRCRLDGYFSGSVVKRNRRCGTTGILKVPRTERRLLTP